MIVKAKCRNAKAARRLKKECRAMRLAFKMLDSRTLRIEAFGSGETVKTMLEDMRKLGIVLKWWEVQEVENAD